MTDQDPIVLGSHLGWPAFRVARMTSSEALGELFQYRLFMTRGHAEGSLDVAGLVGTGATLRIATQQRWRHVHGVITAAELVQHTSDFFLFHAVLEPHFVTARYRRRCRTFVEKSLIEIVESAFDGLVKMASMAPVSPHPSFATFQEPRGFYRWALTDPERAERPRRFTVQYNETDLEFASRLLEEEGITFLFEHGNEGDILTLTDFPGAGSLFDPGERHELVGSTVGGRGQSDEAVRIYRQRFSLHSSSVTMRDYAWRQSRRQLEASIQVPSPLQDLDHYEYPARDEDEPARPGAAPARFLAERKQLEQQLSEGVSTVRSHQPGYALTLEDASGLRGEVEVIPVELETVAQVHEVEGTILDFEPLPPRFLGTTLKAGMFEVRFSAIPKDLRFRPARQTKRPTIAGVQTARVTADEVAPDESAPELNSDEMGRVRVRFPWDQRTFDGTPTSKWIRVSHAWAGPGFGQQYVPRVGHEVLVAFERGDPDRPIIVGRVYNAQNPPPYPERNTTRSTIRSDSVGRDGESADGFNEFRFEDARNEEEVFLHAERNLNEVVKADHSTSVGGNQSNSVGANQSNYVRGNRSHRVDGNEDCSVGANRTHHVGGTEFCNVESDRTHLVGGFEHVGVTGDRTTVFLATEAHTTVGTRWVTAASDNFHYFNANHEQHVSANQTIVVGGHRSVAAPVQEVSIGTDHHQSAGASFTSDAPVHAFSGDLFMVRAGSATLTMNSGFICLDNGAGATLSLVGSLIVATGSTIADICSTRTVSAATHYVGATNIIQDASASLSCNGGGSVSITSSGNVSVIGANVLLNP